VASLLDSAKQAIEARARRIGVSVAVDVVALLFFVVALFFFTLAAFILAQDAFGTVTASLALGGAYVAFGLGSVLAARRIARRAVPAEHAEPARLFGRANAGQSPEWLAAPVVIAAGVEIMRRLGANRLIPAFALSAVALTAAQMAARSKRGEPNDGDRTSKT
jgi:membrane associated rhomboid family serine protease